MELKGVLTVTMFAGVILLSFLASSVICRPNNQDIRPSSSSHTSSSNYLLGQHNQQHYDEHHRYPHRSSHHHHHNNHPHHHSPHGHGHNEKLEEETQHHLQHDEVFRANGDAGAISPDIDESNKISPLHSTTSRRSQRYSQRQALPAASSSASSSTTSTRGTTSSKSNFPTPRRLADEEYDYDNEEEDEEDDSGAGGRHAYLMTTDKKSSKEKMTEDEALTQAFEKHMRPSSSIGKGTPKEEVHDVYAYQLPSDLWFIVRYNKNADGQVEKYMNIVDSFTNYLDKLDKDVKTVSVNVKGVETVFRLTTKHNNSSSSNS